MSMWEYAVQSVRKALRSGGVARSEYVAGQWQRNLGFDQFKLLAAAKNTWPRLTSGVDRKTATER